jgi:hypothetical protein
MKSATTTPAKYHRSPQIGVICPKCGVNPLADRSRWCKSCKAEANTKYRRKKSSLIKQLMAAVVIANANKGKKKS